MTCPTCNRKLADNARTCPSCQHDLVAHRKQQALARLIAGTLLLIALALAALVALSPGIIINGLRGRYRNRTGNLILAAVRDWQTWLISLPISTVAFLVLSSLGVFDGIAGTSEITPARDSESRHADGFARNSNEITSALRERLLQAKRSLDASIEVESAKLSALEKMEMEQAQREEQAAIRSLEAVRKSYPLTPAIAQKSYQAGEQMRKIQRQYEFKYAAIRDKYAAKLRQQRDELDRTYQAEIATIKSGVPVVSQNSDDRHAAAVAMPPSALLSPLRRAHGDAGASEPLYSVIGVTGDDTLNVRSGPGANYDIVATLPNGYQGIRLVGAPVVNGTTTWAQITFGGRTGWAAKDYLQPE